MLSNEKSSLLKNEQISSSYSSSDEQNITPKRPSLNTETQCVVDYRDNDDFASDDNGSLCFNFEFHIPYYDNEKVFGRCAEISLIPSAYFFSDNIIHFVIIKVRF